LDRAETVVELPAALLATRTNRPKAEALIATVSVADVPDEPITAFVMASRFVEDGNEKVAPVRLLPVITNVEIVVPANAPIGLMVETTGTGRTTTLPDQETVTPPTVTLTIPLLAFGGTKTLSEVAVADTTVAGAPPMVTTFADGVVLKFWPRMVIVDP
jgi:hypothetical protein